MMKIDKIKTPYAERVKIILDILENKYSYLFINKDYSGFREYEKLTNCSIFTFRSDLLKMRRPNKLKFKRDRKSRRKFGYKNSINLTMRGIKKL